MSEDYSNSLNLILPVYRGGELFRGAIESVEKSNIYFDNIFVSFNGVESADYDFLLGMISEKNPHKKYTILRTKSELTAVEHGKFIVINLKKILSPSSMLMMLAHDDRLLDSNLGIKDGVRTLNHLFSNTVYIPSYSFCWSNDYSSITQVVESNEVISPEDFFWKSMRENIPTNMSGMIIPLFAMEEAQVMMAQYENGARFEHILCISRGIKHVKFTNEIKVLIGERLDSDGKLLSPLEHRRAAIHYMLTYLRNRRLNLGRDFPKFMVHFSKKAIAFWLTKIKLL